MAITVQIKRGLKANAPALAIGESFFCTDTKQWLTGSSGGNVIMAPFPVYDATGALQSNMRMVVGAIALPSGGSATITLSGNAAFTSASSYQVFVTDSVTKRTLNVVKNSGTSFTISGGGTGDVVSYLCVGN